MIFQFFLIQKSNRIEITEIVKFKNQTKPTFCSNRTKLTILISSVKLKFCSPLLSINFDDNIMKALNSNISSNEKWKA